jgi:Tfp pilus assembly protein PilV
MKRNQSGIAHLGVLLLLLVVAVVAFAGYKVVQSRQNKTASNQTSTAVTTQNLNTPIKSTSDLNTAESTLNSQPVDNDLNPNQWDSDVNSLL